MKIVIEVPDELIDHAKNVSEDSYDEWDAMRAIAKGFPYEERPHGKWIYHTEWYSDGECAFECSKCGKGTDVDYNFCPNCGADMRKEGGKK